MNEPAISRLRPMGADDVPQCVPLLAQLGYEMTAGELAQRLREVMATPDHAILVVEIAGKAAGLLHIYARPALENPREAVMQAIVVDKRHRRAGLGRTLMAAAEHWGQQHNCRSLVLSSNVTRAPAHAFYAALGYHVSATSLIFRKPLAPAHIVAGLTAKPGYERGSAGGQG